MLTHQVKWLSKLVVVAIVIVALPANSLGDKMKSSKFSARVDFNSGCKSGYQVTDLDVQPTVAMCVNYPDGASSYLSPYAGREVQIEARLKYDTRSPNPKSPKELDKLIRVGKAKLHDPYAPGFWGYVAAAAGAPPAMIYPPSGADSQGTASPGPSSQSTAVPNSPQTKLTSGVPQCGRAEWDNKGNWYLINSCSIKVTITFTSQGPTWGTTTVAAGERKVTEIMGMANQRQTIWLYTCPNDSTPVTPSGKPFGRDYNGSYSCYAY